MRASGERRELILVAVTGYVQESDRAKSAAAGVKPLDLAAFELLQRRYELRF